MKIYTKTGDKGTTGLWGGLRVPKDHPRVSAYGDVDELNSCLGAVISLIAGSAPLAEIRGALSRIQGELFVVGALLATPPAQAKKLGPPFDQGLPPGSAVRLETEIDRLTASLKPMSKFILPGGGPAGAGLHLARTVCRRAERSAVRLSSAEKIPDGLVIYLNRLSDYLFTAARWVNARQKRPETQWEGLPKR